MNRIHLLKLTVNKGLSAATDLLNLQPAEILNDFQHDESNDIICKEDHTAYIYSQVTEILHDFISIRNKLIKLQQYQLYEEEKISKEVSTRANEVLEGRLDSMGFSSREEIPSTLEEIPYQLSSDD